MSERVELDQCDEEWLGHRCTRIAGHGYIHTDDQAQWHADRDPHILNRLARKIEWAAASTSRAMFAVNTAAHYVEEFGGRVGEWLRWIRPSQRQKVEEDRRLQTERRQRIHDYLHRVGKRDE